MFRFLRQLRFRLLQQNATSKYLKYAIGEILLVVIGILIALQINNWNADNISKEKEKVYLANIKRDLQQQLNIIDEQMVYETKITTIATPIIEQYKRSNRFTVDSLFTASIGVLSGRKTFVQHTPTYTELISSGNIDIIRDNVLKDHIIKYYQELERNELIINKNNNLFNDAVFIPEMLRLSELQIVGEFTFNMLALYNKKSKVPFIDLNEPKLKQITKNQLKDPENELRMINGINFRNFISIIHLQILHKQKESTQNLLKNLP